MTTNKELSGEETIPIPSFADVIHGYANRKDLTRNEKAKLVRIASNLLRLTKEELEKRRFELLEKQLDISSTDEGFKTREGEYRGLSRELRMITSLLSE